MKITISGHIAQNVDGVWEFPITIPDGESQRTLKLALDNSYDPTSLEPTRPLGNDTFPLDGSWAYGGLSVQVRGASGLSLDEIGLHIKHTVLRRDKTFSRMRRELEALENIERTDVARRERIPDAVRLFVWQRDQGKCVRCRSVEKLEFDHIIPIVKGGSNTERNIQLLCERCNRSKGATI